MSAGTPSRRRAPVWLVPALVLLVAAALVAVLVQRDAATDSSGADGVDGPGPAAAPSEPPTSDDGPAERAVDPGEEAGGAPEGSDPFGVERREEGDPLASGPVDAHVVMVVYSDYQCPYCALWSEQTAPAMLDLAEAGVLRIEWRDIDVFGEDSARGARAAYAAALQDRYLDYHGALFADGDRPSAATLTEDGLVGLAEEVGLDVERFRADLGSAEVADAVARNVDEARRIGAFSTPSFLINGEPLVGAQPTQVFRDAVAAALDRADP